MCIPNDRPSETKDNLGMTVFKMIFFKITLIRAYVQCTIYTGCNISAYDKFLAILNAVGSYGSPCMYNCTLTQHIVSIYVLAL